MTGYYLGGCGASGPGAPLRTQPRQPRLRSPLPPGLGSQSRRGRRDHRTTKGTSRARATQETEPAELAKLGDEEGDPTGPCCILAPHDTTGIPIAAPHDTTGTPNAALHDNTENPIAASHDTARISHPRAPHAARTEAAALLEGLLGRHGAGVRDRRLKLPRRPLPLCLLSPQLSQVTRGTSARAGPRAAPTTAMTGVAESRAVCACVPAAKERSVLRVRRLRGGGGGGGAGELPGRVPRTCRHRSPSAHAWSGGCPSVCSLD